MGGCDGHIYQPPPPKVCSMLVVTAKYFYTTLRRDGFCRRDLTTKRGSRSFHHIDSWLTEFSRMEGHRFMKEIRKPVDKSPMTCSRGRMSILQNYCRKPEFTSQRTFLTGTQSRWSPGSSISVLHILIEQQEYQCLVFVLRVVRIKHVSKGIEMQSKNEWLNCSNMCPEPRASACPPWGQRGTMFSCRAYGGELRLLWCGFSVPCECGIVCHFFLESVPSSLTLLISPGALACLPEMAAPCLLPGSARKTSKRNNKNSIQSLRTLSWIMVLRFKSNPLNKAWRQFSRLCAWLCIVL